MNKFINNKFINNFFNNISQKFNSNNKKSENIDENEIKENFNKNDELSENFNNNKISENFDDELSEKSFNNNTINNEKSENFNNNELSEKSFNNKNNNKKSKKINKNKINENFNNNNEKSFYKNFKIKTIFLSVIVLGLLFFACLPSVSACGTCDTTCACDDCFDCPDCACVACNVDGSSEKEYSKNISQIINGSTLSIGDGVFENYSRIAIDKNVTIQGNGANNSILFTGSDVAFHVLSGNTLTLYNLTIITNHVFSDEEIADYNALVGFFNGTISGSGNVVFENCKFINNGFTTANVILDVDSTYNNYYVNITATVKDANGDNLNGSVLFYIDNVFHGRVYANDGIANFIFILPNGDYSVHAVFIGDGFLNPKISRNKKSFSVMVLSRAPVPLPTTGHIIYVSPTGSDSNDGLTPGAPKASIFGGTSSAYTTVNANGYIVLLPGVYAGTGHRGGSVSKNVTFIGDPAGNVTVVTNGTTFATLSLGTAANPRNVSAFNIKFHNSTAGRIFYVNGYNTLNIDNCEFMQITGVSLGAGLYLIGRDITLNFYNTDVRNVRGNDIGGFIRFDGAYVNQYINLNNSNFTNVSSVNYCGVICTYTSNVVYNINNCNFIGCSAGTRHAGVLCMDGDYILVNNSNFINSSAATTGGSIYAHPGGASRVAYIINSTFVNSISTNYYSSDTGTSMGTTSSSSLGGAIATNGNLNIYDSVFVNCTAKYGGAIFTDAGTTNIYNTTFEDNYISYLAGTEARFGGAIGLNGGTISAYDSYFKNNKVHVTTTTATSVLGGAIGVTGSSGRVNLYNSTFEDNFVLSDGTGTTTKTAYGGAVAATAGFININQCNFTNNYAISNATGGTRNAYGGAIGTSATSASINITSSNFDANYVFGASDSYGGAFGTSGGTINILNSNITRNSANYGGAVAAVAAGTNTARINVISSYLAENSATTFGGAIGVSGTGSTIVVNDSVVHNNSAGTYGGAVGISSGDFSTTGSNYTWNTAGTYGGAIGSTTNFYVNYGNFFNNSAGTVGGAIASLGSTTNNTIFGSSFVNNYAVTDGTAIYAAGRGNINYNRFFANNDTPARVYSTVWTNVSQGSNMNIDLNWWGNNTHFSTGIIPNNYIVLDVNYTDIPLYNRTAHFFYFLRLNTGATFDESRLPTFFGNVAGVVQAYSYNITFLASESHYIGIPFSPYGYLDGMFTVDWWRNEFANISTVTTPNITSQNVFGKYKNLTELNATVTDSAGYVLDNMFVVFYIDGVAVGNGTTDSNGFVSIIYNVTSAGNFSFVSNYTGNDLNFLSTYVTYNASFDRRNTSISAIDVIGRAFETTYLNATIVDEYGEFVENVFISFHSLTGIMYAGNYSNASGFASAGVIFNNSGNYSFYAYFDGNGNYSPSNSSVGGYNIATITFEYIVQNNTYNLYVNSSGGNDAFLGVNWDYALQSIFRALAIVKEQNWTSYTVHIAPGVYSGSLNVNQNVSDNATFLGYSSLGGDIVFDGNFTSRSGFNVLANANVNIYNITFVRGLATDGGAIYSSGSLNVYNSKFENNNGTDGGAIYNNNSNLSVSDSSFTNNTVFSSTGNSQGGAIYTNYGSVSIANSIFSYNLAHSSGIFGDGGAIFNNNSNVIVSDSNFVNNTANYGGAINNVIDDNNVFISSLTVSNSNFINNTGFRQGGAIQSYGSARVTGSSFINSSSDFGGAIISYGDFNVSSSNFFNNTANYFGGAIYSLGNATHPSNFVLTNSNVTSNVASQGGAVYHILGNFFTNGSNFTNNIADFGGAIYGFSMGNVTSNSSSFTNNTANNDGGAIYSSGDLNLTNSNFTNNIANGNGGGVYVRGANNLISGSNFTNNSQAIALATTNFSLSNNIIEANEIGIQFVLNNMNYTISGLSANNNIRDNLFAIGISGNGSNYTVNDNFASLNNGGFIFTGNNNAIVNSTITGYNRSDSWAVFFHGSSSNNSIISSNITGNLRAIGINGTNNSVIGSNIMNNDLGIHVLSGSSNAVINFNRIFNNTNSLGVDLVNEGTNTNADYNWWGTNIPLVSGISLNNWFVMELSANTNKTLVNATIFELMGNVELAYQLSLLDNSTGVTGIFDVELLPYFLVNLIWTGPNGTVYNLTNVDGRRRYSQNVTLDVYDVFSLQAIADNSDIILILNSDLSETVNLSITKTSNVTGNASVGDLVEYNITVVNHGPANATNLTVTDILDYRLIFESANGNYNYTTGIWYIGNLAAGGNITLTIIVRINGTGDITNIANVTVNELNLGNNSTDGNGTNFTVPPTVNLTIDKFHNASGVNVGVGDLVEFTIVVTNHGPDNATGVVVVDALDPRLIYHNSTSGGTFNGTHVIWNVGFIPMGTNVTLALVVIVNGTGNIVNIANVTVNETNIGNNSTDGNGSNFTVNATVNLSITKTNNLTPGAVVNVGDLVTYTITVTNHGPDIATDVRVIDVLDSRLIFVSATGYYNESNGLWILGNLNVGSSLSMNITVRVNGTGNIVNIANVSADQHNIGNNTTDGNGTNFTVDPTVNLTITKIHNATGVNVGVGDLVEYTIVVTNFGPDNATSVVIVDALDPRLVYINSTSGGSFNGTHVLWNVGLIPMGTNVTLTLVVIVNGTGNITNLANVTVNETNIGNNSTDGNGTNFTVDPTVNLTITKTNNLTSGAVVNVGDLIEYTIVVTNFGPDNATGVVVSDALDPRLVYINSTGGGIFNGTHVVWNVGGVNVGTNVTLTLVVSVNGTG
ncbi:MAG: hypothetical protein FWH29_02675, partial [Methanobrevibacter sp.]|nr:hypothetical protein [Methanobrevibacter sp.]